MNKTKISKKKICIGFGKYEGKCKNIAGTPFSDHWCPRCDLIRRKKISKQLLEISNSFD